MLTFEGFVDYKWLERDMAFESEETGNHIWWTIHYYLKDKASLTDYLEKHAPAMRADGLKKFPYQFSATRRVLSPVA